MFDVERERLALLPGGQVARSLGIAESALGDRSEEVFPGGVAGRQPFGGSMGDQLFLHAVALAPGVDLPQIAGSDSIRRKVLDLGQVHALRKL